jgi:hypothetical protein
VTPMPRRPTIALLAAGLVAISLASPAGAAHGRPNQGNARHVLTVDDPTVRCDAVPGPKMNGGRSGRFLQVRSEDPIDRVTLKSGNGASVVHSTMGNSEGMYWMTIELSKHIGNYVVWTCPDGAHPVVPRSPGGRETPGVPTIPALGPPITFEAVWDCAIPRSEGPIEDVATGGSVEIRDSDPIDHVSLVAGEGADVLETDLGYTAGEYWVTLELSEDIASYEVWSCPDEEVIPSATTTAARPLADAIADGDSLVEALRARFPTTVSDIPVEVTALSAEAWLASGDSGTPADEAAAGRALQSLADAAGVTIDDIAVATGLLEPSPGNRAVIAAVGVPGADGQGLVDDVIDAMLGDIVEPRTAPESLAGKSVLRVTDAATPGVYPRNVYVDGDIVWLIEADDPLRTEIAAALP